LAEGRAARSMVRTQPAITRSGKDRRDYKLKTGENRLSGKHVRRAPS